MRYSKQRETIYKALKENPVHPTADYIYGLLKGDNPSLSLGTVYRNLNLLAEVGRIKRIQGLDGCEHFDHTIYDHCHIICEKCSAVEDILIPQALEQDLKALKNKTDFKITCCDIVLRGLCKNCKGDN